MSKVAQIRAQQAQLAQELEIAMKEERAAVIAQMRKDIVEFKITATDLKGVVKGRVTDKQVEEFLEKQKKKAAKAKPKSA